MFSPNDDYVALWQTEVDSRLLALSACVSGSGVSGNVRSLDVFVSGDSCFVMHSCRAGWAGCLTHDHTVLELGKSCHGDASDDGQQVVLGCSRNFQPTAHARDHFFTAEVQVGGSYVV